MILTNHYQALMIALLSQKTKAGIRTPHKGHQRPLSNVVFLCPSKTQAALCRLNSVMAGCIGQPLKRLAGSFAGSSNLIQSATQRFEPKGGGLFPYKGVPAMRKYAQISAKSSQTKQSKFNLIKRTTEGKRSTCRDLILLKKSPWLLVNASRNCEIFQNEGYTMSNQSKEPIDQAHEQSRLMLDDRGYPVTLDYFYVAHDLECSPGHIIKQHRLSPNYRTAEEAERFLELCNVEGAAIYKESFPIRTGDDIEGLEKELFEGTALRKQFDVHCYAVTVAVVAAEKTIINYPISPWFHTHEEARSFQQQVIDKYPDCRIGHWCFEADNEERRQELITQIFCEQ